jgi:hypothetical protein
MPNQPQSPQTPKQDANEGEGSRTAARNYDAKTEQYVKSGKVDAAAQAAKKALEGGEKAELEAAEKIGKEGEPKATFNKAENNPQTHAMGANTQGQPPKKS